MTTESSTYPIILEGALSIEAAIKAQSRDIHEILIADHNDNPNVARFERLANARALPVSRVPSATIDAHASGATHGGIIALAGPRKFLPLESLASGAMPTALGRHADAAPFSTSGSPNTEPLAPNPFFIMVDGVEDPYNFGSAVRSAYAAGATGLVVRPRNWFTAAGLVARASAGASESIPTAVAETAEAAAKIFRAAGYVIACADETPDAVSLYDVDMTRPIFLLIGGEKRGITRSFRDAADVTLRIPYGASTNISLGTAAAAAVISFEILRQRTAAGIVGAARPKRPTPPRPHRALLPPRRRR